MTITPTNLTSSSIKSKTSKLLWIKRFFVRHYRKVKMRVPPIVQNKHIRFLIVAFVSTSFLQMNLVYFVISWRDYALTELGEAVCNAYLENYFLLILKK